MTTRSALLSRLVLAAGLPLAGCASSDPPPTATAASVPPATGSVGRPADPSCPPGQTHQVGLTANGPGGACLPMGAVLGRPLRVVREVRVAAMTVSAAWG